MKALCKLLGCRYDPKDPEYCCRCGEWDGWHPGIIGHFLIWKSRLSDRECLHCKGRMSLWRAMRTRESFCSDACKENWMPF